MPHTRTPGRGRPAAMAIAAAMLAACCGCTSTSSSSTSGPSANSGPPPSSSGPPPGKPPLPNVTPLADPVVTFTDRQGDVVLSGPEALGWAGARPAPKAKQADIVRATVEHNPRQILSRVELADDPRTTLVGLYRFVTDLKTNTGMKRAAEVHHGHFVGDNTVLSGVGPMGYRYLRCPGLRYSVDHARSEVTTTIPRRCLGNPAWVQARVFVIAWLGGGAVTLDDGSTDGSNHPARPTFSAPIPEP